MKTTHGVLQLRFLIALALACNAALPSAGSVSAAGSAENLCPVPGIGIAVNRPPAVMIEVFGKREENGESAGPGRREAARRETARNEDAEGLPEAGGPGALTLIRGTVAVTGNEPHTRVLLVDEATGERFSIIPEETMERMRNLQGELVDCTVRLLDESPSGEGKRPLPARAVNPLSWKIVR